MSDRKQTHTTGKGWGDDWTRLEVQTCEGYDANTLASRTRIDTRQGATFVDVCLEEYTGTTRRAKYTSVRLQEAAGRALFEQLRAIYEPTAGDLVTMPRAIAQAAESFLAGFEDDTGSGDNEGVPATLAGLRQALGHVGA